MGKSHNYMQILQGNALFSGKIYTVGNIFTRPPVVTVVTKFEVWPQAIYFENSFFHWISPKNDSILNSIKNKSIGQNIHSIESRIFNRLIHSKKIEENYSKFQFNQLIFGVSLFNNRVSHITPFFELSYTLLSTHSIGL